MGDDENVPKTDTNSTEMIHCLKWITEYCVVFWEFDLELALHSFLAFTITFNESTLWLRKTRTRVCMAGFSLSDLAFIS